MKLGQWCWVEVFCFLYHNTKFGRDSIINGSPQTTQAVDKWQHYSSRTTCSTSLMCRIHLDGLEKPHSCGSFGTRHLWWTNTGPILPLASISRQCIFCFPNTRQSMKQKVWDRIQFQRVWKWVMFIMHKLCIVRTCNYDSFNWKQTLFGEGCLRNLLKWIGTFYEAFFFGLFGLNKMNKCSTKNNGTSPRLNISFGMTSLCMPRWFRRGSLCLLGIVPTQLKHLWMVWSNLGW